MAEEFYTHELQEKMDVSKWLDSEQAHRDLCGNYEYCAFCNKAEEFPCANAYVRMTEKENAEKEREALAAAEAAEADDGMTVLGKTVDLDDVKRRKAARKSLSFAVNFSN